MYLYKDVFVWLGITSALMSCWYVFAYISMKQIRVCPTTIKYCIIQGYIILRRFGEE